MKPSRFNYIVEDDGDAIFFNGLTEAFFRVPLSRRDVYKTILDYPNDHYDSFRSFIDRVKTDGFVMDDKADEDALLKQKFESLRCHDLYHALILPTYQCNLRCWYCIQHHQEMWMDDETVAAIKRRIELKLNDDKIRQLNISWFGGEPLMAYDRLLEITQFAQKTAADLNKVFSASITTNGTLLTRERIDALEDAGITSYQISIDGNRKAHNKVKVLPDGASAFDRALENIDYLARRTYCTLRFNYTKETLDPDSVIEDLAGKLSEESKKKISFLIYKVWQEDESTIDQALVDRLYDLSKDLGLSPRFKEHGLCYVDQINYDCIFPNGKVGKCDNLDPDCLPGQLNPDGTISWKMIPASFTSSFMSDSSDCNRCRHVAFCWGPCYTRREKMLSDHGRLMCQFEDRNKEIKQQIIEYVKSTESGN